MNADEVTALATDHGNPGSSEHRSRVSPLTLAEPEGLGSCEQHWRFRYSGWKSSPTSAVKVSQDPLYDVTAGTASAAHMMMIIERDFGAAPSMGTESSTDALAVTTWGRPNALVTRFAGPDVPERRRPTASACASVTTQAVFRLSTSWR